jgi:molecular chaperone GrpE
MIREEEQKIQEEDIEHTVDHAEQATSAPSSPAGASQYQTSGNGQEQEQVIEGEVVTETGEAVAEGEVVTEGPAAGTDVSERLREAEKQAAEFKDQWLRTVADFKNYKRRSEAEREELRKNAHAGLILKLLPVLDDIERAAENVPEDIAASTWWEGMTLVSQKLRMLLESEGVHPIVAEGEQFDPNKHHAISYEEAEGRDNEVVSVLQKGYLLHDQVLRPAMVRVGKSPEPQG